MLAEIFHLSLCLKHGDFRRLDKTSIDVLELVVRLVLYVFLFFEQFAHQPFNLRNETNQQQCVQHVKAGVEGSQNKRQFQRIRSGLVRGQSHQMA